MDSFFRSDITNLSNSLSQISNNSNATASHAAQTNAILDQLNSNFSNFSAQTQQALTDANTTLDGMYYQVSELLETANYIRDTQFIQNNHLNNVLASIDATLKAPNKTSANEKFEIGIELLQRGKMKHALRMFEEAVELNPLHFGSNMNLSVIHYYEKNYEKALEYAIETLDLLPPSKSPTSDFVAHVHCLVARAYAKNNQFDLAISYINKSILGCSRSIQPFYRYERTKIYALAGQTRDFLNCLYTDIIEDPKYFSISLVESDFRAYQNILEQLLKATKEDLEQTIKKDIDQLKSISIPNYSFKTMPLKSNIYYSTNDYKVIATKPNSFVEYSYENMKKHVLFALEELNIIIHDAEVFGNKAIAENSYEGYIKIYDMMNKYKSRASKILHEIPLFLQRFNKHYPVLMNYLTYRIKGCEERIANYHTSIKKIEDEYKGGLFFKKKMPESEKDNIISAKEAIASELKNIEDIKQAMPELAEHEKEIQKFYEYYSNLPKSSPQLFYNFDIPKELLKKYLRQSKIN